MNYRKIVRHESACYLLNGRMVINANQKDAFITSQVKKLNFSYEVTTNTFSLEVFTQNSVYLVLQVPHTEIAALVEATNQLQLALA